MSTLAINGGKPINESPLIWNNTISEEEINAANEVLRSQTLSDFYGSPGAKFLGGKQVRNFEECWSDFFKCRYSVSVNSATSALQIALGAIGIQPGDEVIVPPWTMSATVMAVMMNGGTPVFADIEEEYFTISPEEVEKKITSKTKAVMAVNLFGQACDFGGLKRVCQPHGIKIIEDNAQGPGGTYNGQFLGNCSDIGIFSLNCHKAIQCGEGGVAITNDQDLAYRMQLIRNHGEAVVDAEKSPENTDVIGYNFRLTEINAAIANEQLKKLNDINNYKIEVYEHITNRLSGFDFIKVPKRRENAKHVFYLDPLLFDSKVLGIDRSTFIQALNAEGFKTVGGYVKPLYRLPIFTNDKIKTRYSMEGISSTNCEVCENYHNNSYFYMDMVRHKMTPEIMDKFVNAIDKVATNVDELKSR